MNRPSSLIKSLRGFRNVDREVGMANKYDNEQHPDQNDHRPPPKPPSPGRLTLELSRWKEESEHLSQWLTHRSALALTTETSVGFTQSPKVMLNTPPTHGGSHSRYEYVSRKCSHKPSTCGGDTLNTTSNQPHVSPGWMTVAYIFSDSGKPLSSIQTPLLKASSFSYAGGSATKGILA